MSRHLRAGCAISPEGALALHHFKTGVEFVAALGAAHTVALDRPLFAGHSHATAVRTASYLGSLARSEEHTSELQSRSDLVCRLLLEKKNMTELDSHELVSEIA